MYGSSQRAWLAGLLAVSTLAGCAGARTSASNEPDISVFTAPRQPYSEADIHFMSGMIPHHAQAVLIAGWAESHGAGRAVRVLSERIAVAQRDEIAMMQGWLRARGQPVPEADATHLTMTTDGTTHDMLMPGMLTAEELATLDLARGEEFERLFLTSMVRHHQGAITMVEQLFGSHGAAQDDIVYMFASDVYADQTTEIERMQRMLESLTAGGGS